LKVEERVNGHRAGEAKYLFAVFRARLAYDFKRFMDHGARFYRNTPSAIVNFRLNSKLCAPRSRLKQRAPRSLVPQRKWADGAAWFL
jgi:hypothetical protein